MGHDVYDQSYHERGGCTIGGPCRTASKKDEVLRGRDDCIFNDEWRG